MTHAFGAVVGTYIYILASARACKKVLPERVELLSSLTSTSLLDNDVGLAARGPLALTETSRIYLSHFSTPGRTRAIRP